MLFSQFFQKTLAIAGFLLFLTNLASGQSYRFGQNKVHYKNFDWAVFRTEHFDVHYYEEEEQAAHDAARMAERGYDYLSDVFQHEFKERIPLILYASVNDFQQTNVVGAIGHGTRGVTESLKGRVALPITGSYRQFNHVLVHELVHAFQFDILLNPGNAGKNAKGLGNPPLWFVEGMAEYLSIEMDTITRMWVRDGLMHNKLLTVDQLNTTQDIRVYRIGESLWYYIGEKHGKQKVGEILKSAVQMGSIQKALLKHTGLTANALTKKWHAAMREQMLPESEDLQESAKVAQKLTKKQNAFHSMNVLPAISPDGKQVAFMTNKNLIDDVAVLKENADGKFTQKHLIKGSRSTDFEALRYLETGMSWSMDGKKLAFISKSGKDDAIHVVDAESGKKLRKLVFDDLNGLLSPAFSPDGNEIVFVGITGGRSDLYIVDIATKERQQLTADRYADMHPAWSPDGKRIAFITDRGEGTNIDDLLFGDLDLALYDIATREIEQITNLKGNTISPQWSPQSNEIAFVSDHQGVSNIYKLDLDSRAIEQVTALKSGVAGITELTPALSWSADGKYLAFSSFEKSSWQIYRMEMPESKKPFKIFKEDITTMASVTTGESVGIVVLKNADDDTLKNDKPWLPELKEQNDIYTGYTLENVDSVEARKYKARPSFDGGSVGANVGGYFGSTAGLGLQFSDMLGNHVLQVSTGLRLNLLNSDLGLAYLNQGQRLNFGAQVFQSRLNYAAFATFNQLGVVEDNYRGFNGIVQYPFNRFMRIELGAGLTRVDRNYLLDTFTGNRRNRERSDVFNVTFGQAYTAFVFDNTAYGFIGPLSGTRARFEVERAFDDFSFTTVSADFRRYFQVSSRSTLAFRVLGLGSYGRDAQLYAIGGPYTFRGADYNSLYGTKFVVQNLEYRFPMFPFAPAQYDAFSAALFFDTAVAWGIDAPGFSTVSPDLVSTEDGFRLNDLKAAFGVGARFNLGYFAIKYDLGFPTDLRNIDKPVSLFSIGVDF